MAGHLQRRGPSRGRGRRSWAPQYRSLPASGDGQDEPQPARRPESRAAPGAAARARGECRARRRPGRAPRGPEPRPPAAKSPSSGSRATGMSPASEDRAAPHRQVLAIRRRRSGPRSPRATPARGSAAHEPAGQQRDDRRCRWRMTSSTCAPASQSRGRLASPASARAARGRLGLRATDTGSRRRQARLVADDLGGARLAGARRRRASHRSGAAVEDRWRHAVRPARLASPAMDLEGPAIGQGLHERAAELFDRCRARGASAAARGRRRGRAHAEGRGAGGAAGAGGPRDGAPLGSRSRVHGVDPGQRLVERRARASTGRPWHRPGAPRPAREPCRRRFRRHRRFESASRHRRSGRRRSRSVSRSWAADWRDAPESSTLEGLTSRCTIPCGVGVRQRVAQRDRDRDQSWSDSRPASSSHASVWPADELGDEVRAVVVDRRLVQA